MEELIGKKKRFELTDGQLISGEVFSITHDVWGRKRKAEPTVNIRVKEGMAHVAARNIKRII